MSSSEFAPNVPVPYYSLALTATRFFYTFFLVENPLVWNFWQGKRNALADMEGPYYVLGAPSRQIEEGKAVLASVDLLKKSVPYLLSVRVLTPDGDPIANATLDFWQADSDGNYYGLDYTLRGKTTTDADGYADVLTVPPGAYGPAFAKRSGHIHVVISPPKDKANDFDNLTSQIYICPANDSKLLESDFLNWARSPRKGNVAQSWSIASAHDGANYMDFPELSNDDSDTSQRVAWWNTKLAQKSDDLRVVSGATVEIKLNRKSGWF